uniref:Uncharacterized protein n=1 Tax=Cacopsylla melanoneura TaxID=428564 RepID=A0A8D8UCM3_9HEMI
MAVYGDFPVPSRHVPNEAAYQADGRNVRRKLPRFLHRSDQSVHTIRQRSAENSGQIQNQFCIQSKCCLFSRKRNHQVIGSGQEKQTGENQPNADWKSEEIGYYRHPKENK